MGIEAPLVLFVFFAAVALERLVAECSSLAERVGLVMGAQRVSFPARSADT